eukprot:749153-Hanusia_phi.AAC.2
MNAAEMAEQKADKNTTFAAEDLQTAAFLHIQKPAGDPQGNKEIKRYPRICLRVKPAKMHWMAYRMQRIARRMRNSKGAGCIPSTTTTTIDTMNLPRSTRRYRLREWSGATTS